MLKIILFLLFFWTPVQLFMGSSHFEIHRRSLAQVNFRPHDKAREQEKQNQTCARVLSKDFVYGC